MGAKTVAFALLLLTGCTELNVQNLRYDSGVIIADADLTPPRPDAAPPPVFPDAAPRPDLGVPDATLMPPDAGANPDAAPVFRDAAPPDTGLINYAGPPIDPLVGIGNVEVVRENFGFLEGPVWDEEHGVLLFSDIANDRIVRFRPPNTFDVFRTPSNGANGLAIDRQGRLYSCEGTSRSIVRGSIGGGPSTTFASRWNNQRLNSPNDLVIRSDGVVFFTDPPYGLMGPREIMFNGIFSATEINPTFVNVRDEFQTAIESRPNGMVLFPDERTIIISNTFDGHISTFDVQPNGELTRPFTWIITSPEPDGVAIDSIGNVFVATSAGIEVYDMAPPNARWGTITVPRQPSNMAWGDADKRTLYITAREGLYRVRLTHPGLHD